MAKIILRLKQVLNRLACGKRSSMTIIVITATTIQRDRRARGQTAEADPAWPAQ